MRTLATLAVTLLVAHVAIAQFPARTRFVATISGLGQPTGVLGLDLVGRPTAFVPIPNTSLGVVEMNATNDGLLIHDRNDLHRLDLTTGLRSTAPMNGFLADAMGPVYGLTVDENGGIAWHQGPFVCRALSTSGLGARTVTQLLVGGGARGPLSPCLNGTTGEFVSCSYGSPGSPIGQMQFSDRNGNGVRLFGGFTYLTDWTWSPWTGDLIVTDRAGVLLRVTQSGAQSTIATLPAQPWGVEVLHQNAANREAFLVSASSGSLFRPNSVFVVSNTGTVTTLISGAPTALAVEALHGRPLWANGPWIAGSAGRLNLNMGNAFAGDGYRLALAFAHAPGIALAGAHVHLVPDALFALTAGGDVPGLTSGFVGQLDASGRAIVPPTVNIPRGLHGLRVFGGAVTFDATGITGATNSWGITIE